MRQLRPASNAKLTTALSKDAINVKMGLCLALRDGVAYSHLSKDVEHMMLLILLTVPLALLIDNLSMLNVIWDLMDVNNLI